MSNTEVILTTLQRSEGCLCYDCLSRQSGVSPRQQVYQLCARLADRGVIQRRDGLCESCRKAKTVSCLHHPEVVATKHKPVEREPTTMREDLGIVARQALSERELAKSEEIAERLAAVRAMLREAGFPSVADYRGWYDVIIELRTLQGNVSNDLGFFATLMAKEFLRRRHGLSFDAAAKAQGARGLDIDAKTDDGERVIAEIKTTVPYGQRDFGAQQAVSIKRDVDKLTVATADHKYLLVTALAAFEAVKRKGYLSQGTDIRLVLLTTGEEHPVQPD